MGHVYLVRHAQASFGADDYDKLSALGHLQASVVGAALSTRARDAHLVSGTMRRHLETAASLGAAETDARWNEFDYLDVIRAMRPDLDSPKALSRECKAADDPNRAFQTLYDAAMARWASGLHDDDYAESRSVFRARVSGAFSALGAMLGRDAAAFVFTSGGPISAIVQDVLDLSEDDTRKVERVLYNAGLTKLSIGAKKCHLISLNEHHHLEAEDGALVTYR